MTPAKCFAIGAVTLLSSANVNMNTGGYKVVLTKGSAPEAAPAMFQLLDKNNKPIECKEGRR